MDDSSLVPVHKLESAVEGSDSHTPTPGLRQGPVLRAQCHHSLHASPAVDSGAARRARRWRAAQQGGVLSALSPAGHCGRGR